MNINNTKRCQFVIMFSMCFFINIALSQEFDPTCDDGQEYFEDVTMSGVTTNATDSVEATKEYLKIATLNIETICSSPDTCSKGTKCEIKGLDITKYPKHRQNDDDDTWTFDPDVVRVGFSCICKSTVTKVDLIQVGIGGQIIDPLIGNDSPTGQGLENRQYDVDPGILIYPNPVRDELYVDFKNFSKSGEYEIRVFNTLGTLMETITANTAKDNLDLYPINVNEYGDGIYYLLVMDSTDVLTSSKFVVSQE